MQILRTDQSGIAFQVQQPDQIAYTLGYRCLSLTVGTTTYVKDGLPTASPAEQVKKFYPATSSTPEPAAVSSTPAPQPAGGPRPTSGVASVADAEQAFVDSVRRSPQLSRAELEKEQKKLDQWTESRSAMYCSGGRVCFFKKSVLCVVVCQVGQVCFG